MGKADGEEELGVKGRKKGKDLFLAAVLAQTVD